MPRVIDPFEPTQIRRLVREFGSPLLIVDCARARTQYRKLRRALPQVALHYALKQVTTGEIQLAASLRIDPGRCIDTHLIKRERDIRNALEYGVRTFVADNVDEGGKVKSYRERAAAVV